MYWQSIWYKPDSEQELKDEILGIRKKHANYGYRRIHACLLNYGWKINKKKFIEYIKNWVSKLQTLGVTTEDIIAT